LMLWDSEYYGHPGFCYNYGFVNDTILDEQARGVIYAKTMDDALINAHAFQQRFAEVVAAVPWWSYLGNKAMRRRYSGGNGEALVFPDDGENTYRGRQWVGVVNRVGYGIDNFWSFLNMHPEGFERGVGSMTIRWGFKTTRIERLNPIYAGWLWDWNVLNLIYDSLLKRNPHNITEFVPWLAEDFEIGTYHHPLYGECTKASFTLRSDVYWADGTPLTTADIYFTFIELPDLLQARGLPPPWWIPDIENIAGFKIFDPYNFEVLLNVTDIFAAGRIGGKIILPKHIWESIIVSGTPTTFAPDPNLVGSGPWRLKEYVEGRHILLVANKPGSTVQTNLPGSTSITSPKGYFGYHPVSVKAEVDGTSNAKIDYYTQPHTIDYTLYNLYLSGSITADISITHPDGTIYSETGVVITSGSNWTHSWTGKIKGRKETTILVYITSPSELAGTYQWSHVYWSTITEDISGSHYVDSSLRAPDTMVDIKDIALACKAFGTYPGHYLWNLWGKYADIISDYKVDMRDIASISRKFGWKVYP
ncbi:MAG: hypothetical protein DRI61_12665, partial [Chloroflexi bacterium]